ncbi:hypothetical protein F3K34_44370 [Streptomyces sp. LBUM 1486]|uniref:hypothetical protein n=1 Tax=Streptomyces scabiei TaxID=1930 RepID=UPI001B319D18|nr:hypothetical protein [Streptomyces sp. LBUM 1486]MBP5918816.1 hypothetical protein [Streptomyces sp. LBUM 1486]
MPITPEQAAILEAEDRHVRAQVQVYAWMERAEQHQAAADYAMAPEQRADDSERIVAYHRAEVDRALRFAHAWAEAASALVPPPQELEVAQGQEGYALVPPIGDTPIPDPTPHTPHALPPT